MMNVKDAGAHWPTQPCQLLTVEKVDLWQLDSGAPHEHRPHTVQACLALSSSSLYPAFSGQLGTCVSLCTPGLSAGRRATWSDRLSLSIRD